MSPLLLILLPLLSALAVAFAPRSAAFRIATVSTLATLAISLAIGFRRSEPLLTCTLMRRPCGWYCSQRS